jgi:hypothetical protein
MEGRRDTGGPTRRSGDRDAPPVDGPVDTAPRTGGAEGGERDHIEVLSGRTRLLWALAVGLYGVGDLLTTVVGVSSGRAVEAGPVAAGLVDMYGLGAVFPLKLGSLLAFYVLWRLVPDPHAAGVPLGLVLTGALLTSWNALVVLGGAPSVP